MKIIETSLIVAGAVAVAGVAAYIGLKKFKIGASRERSIEEKAREEFAAAADKYSGLYEPLHMMAHGRMKFRMGVIGDWVTRTENLSVAQSYKKIWMPIFSDYTDWNQDIGIERVKELLEFVLESGVCRDSTAEITVDNATYKKYSTYDDDLIEAGNQAKVKTPFWFIGDEILEKGMIEKI